jgi:hypothetical protein
MGNREKILQIRRALKAGSDHIGEEHRNKISGWLDKLDTDSRSETYSLMGILTRRRLRAENHRKIVLPC